MIAPPDQEAEILAQILSFKDDPVAFVQYAYPWGRKGTPFEHLSGPRRWQLADFQRIAAHTQEQQFRLEQGLPLKVYRDARSSGRGPGKSAKFGMLAHWHMSTHIGSTTQVAANTETQLRSKTFPEMAKWFGSAVNSHWFTLEALRIVPAPWLMDLARKLPQEGGLGLELKYWYVYGSTWSEDDPNSFAGTHNPMGLMLLFDEASGIHHGVWDVSEGFFTEVGPYRYWMAASQMRARQGRFYDIFNDPRVGEGWHTQTLSTRGMEGVDQALIEEQIKRYGPDSDFVRVEIDGLPPQTAEDQFIPWELVRQAQANDLVRDEGEPLILGVDIGPRRKSAWRFRQGRNARDCCGSATKGSWFGLDNVQLAHSVAALHSRFQPDAICIDFGMGTGVIDVLRRMPGMRHKVHEVKFGDMNPDKGSEFARMGTVLWSRIREWLPGGMIEKDDGAKGSLSQQLTDRGWKWSQQEDGKKNLETKDDMQRRGVASPDDADALACTFWLPNLPRRDNRRENRVLVAEGVGTSAFFE